jgi:hypothetical protein
MSRNLLPFSADLILGTKKKYGADKSGEYGGGDLFLESLVFANNRFIDTAVCEVPLCRTRESGFHLPEAEALLDKFLEPNETVLLYNIS